MGKAQSASRRHGHVTANIYVLSGKSAAVESAGWKLDENKLESREMDRGNRVKFSPVSGSDDEMGSKGACTRAPRYF